MPDTERHRLERKDIVPGAVLQQLSDKSEFRVDTIDGDEARCMSLGTPPTKRSFSIEKLTQGEWRLARRAA